MKTAVGIPVYNEEATLADLLEFLVREPGVGEVIVVDDCSSDRSLDIARDFEVRHISVRALAATERSGQLAAWRRVAEASTADALCFIDADAMPARGAVGELFAALARDAELVAVSGRTIPDGRSRRWSAARFRSETMHRVRALQRPSTALIGRFFAVRREWFLATATRSDIIANDAYLGGAARRTGRRIRYVPSALCYYAEAQTSFDFAAQRQRADAGYAQLRALRVLGPCDEPSRFDYARVLAAGAAHDPVGAYAWLREQVKARAVRAYRASGRDAGGWDVQPSTKRRLEPPSGKP